MLGTRTNNESDVEIEGYPPIEDFGFIGDSRTGALISRSGAVEWLCLPHFFSESIFASVLDRRKGGTFRICPTASFDTERRYVDDTAVLETVFRTASGAVRLTDAMVVLAESPLAGEPQPARELLRLVEVLEGEVEMEVLFQPRPRYGRVEADIRRHAGMGWACEADGGLALLLTDLPLEQAESGVLRGRVRLRAGDKRQLSLSHNDFDIMVAPPMDEAEQRLEATLKWWRNWSQHCTYRGPYRDRVMRSVITLKLLAYALSGAVLAAPTTSLPEALGGERNWDYRFCWIRDAAYIVRTFMDVGYLGEAEDFFGWLLHATRLDLPNLHILYDVHGKEPGPERELDHLEGYRGSRPVRVSNGARNQLQLDVFGETIVAAYNYVQRGGTLGPFEQRFLQQLCSTVTRCWREPDHGIWEVRGERRHYTFSKLMCWAAMDCMVRMHKDGHLRIDVEAVRRERDKINEAIETRGFNPELGAYVAIFDTDELDASLLRLSRVGYIAADDPKMVGTCERIREKLEHDGLIYRYTPGVDRMPSQEAAFGVCSFWMVSYLVEAGRRGEAQALFERMLEFANDLGLFAEEIDPHTGRQLGNFPQGLTHLGMVDAALALAGNSADEDKDSHG